ncbi:hypothetical protein [Actinoplanes sp. NPDC049681]|uniref:hypothetical protein n=1 Tax=Actinoplanes sp. NPDC049681 TaxID=3363905 RepID=UPI003797E4D7
MGIVAVGAAACAGEAEPVVVETSPAVQFAVGSCIGPRTGPGAGEYREVACADPAATDSILSRFAPDSAVAAQLGRRSVDCPDETDEVVELTKLGPPLAGDSPGGYVCVRSLKPPHPGDPGNGGGPTIVVGDCVTASSKGDVAEIRCGSGKGKSRFRVLTIETVKANSAAAALINPCAAGTDVSFTVGERAGERRVACAKRL